MTEKEQMNQYATTDDGVNYRDIASTMSILGFKMNHSSARNHVLRIMRKFAEAYAAHWGVGVGDDDIDDIIRTPHFQSGVGELLQILQSQYGDEALFIER